MCISINEDGWLSVGAGLQAHEIAEHMGVRIDGVESVLEGKSEVTAPFIAAALLTIPARFADLFTVKI